jgi:hypothetical protein
MCFLFSLRYILMKGTSTLSYIIWKYLNFSQAEVKLILVMSASSLRLM